MGGLWQRCRAWLGIRRRDAAIRERFQKFLAVCGANDEFLGILATMMETADAPSPLSMAELHALYESLRESASTMVSSLVGMSEARYEPLLSVLESMCRNIEISVLKERPIELLPMIVWPEMTEADRVEVVGGKAANLAVLAKRTGVITPPYFVVSSRGYHHFMDATGLADLVRDLLESRRGLDSRSVRETSETLVTQILSAELPADLANEVRAAFGELVSRQRANYGVAVRSSAVVEDSECSFAGQFETVLGVQEDGLLAAYKRVIASKYRPEAIEYARLSGYLDEEVAMPVLVMLMVQPAASGVAYSCDPDGKEYAIVTAVRGLAEASVDGQVIPDRFHVRRTPPHSVFESFVSSNRTVRRCSSAGGTVEELFAGDAVDPAIDAEQASAICALAIRVECVLGCPQDVEWAIDHAGRLFVVQGRPLRRDELLADTAAQAEEREGHRIVASRATATSRWVAVGRVARIASADETDRVPDGAVLVVPTTSPKLAAVVGRVAAIVAETGSLTGHMATVAREFRIPLLIGVDLASTNLREGMVVTVDGRSGTIYEGEVTALLSGEGARPGAQVRHNPVKQCLAQLVEQVSPLTMPEPSSPEFIIARCKTMHDIARFVHQKAMGEMFQIDELRSADKRAARRLLWRVPMEVLVLDLGRGLADEAGEQVTAGEIRSVPLLALIEGMTDPRQRWAGPVGFDLKGFMSVVVRSAADDQRYGEPSFALCSEEYMHFSSRLAYHFATVDAMCSSFPNRNYARFVFFGGAAVAERREWRAHFLGMVLSHNGFEVRRVGDRVEAWLGKLPSTNIEETLVMVGRLMVAARHLDMLMENRAAAEAYANAFLSGDFGFELVRKGMT